MPTVSTSSPTYRMSRTWVRNGPGPKVPHPFSYSMAVIRSTNFPAYFTVSTGGAGAHTGSAPASLKLRLYKDLRDKAYESLQLGADFGERRQTIDMIGSLLRTVRSPLKTVGEYMRKAARRKKTSIGTLLLKDSADAYLAFQYGVKPLMTSLEDACKIFRQPYPRMRVQSRARTSYSDPVYTANSYPKGPDAYVEKMSHIVAMRGGFDAVVENSTVFTAGQLGLLNPLSVAWELVPFSFIVDWFIPVGVYVASLSDYAGCKLTNSYTTEFVRSTGFRSFINRGQFCHDEGVKCIRVLGVPTLPSFRTVDLKLGQSKQHVANALALILSLKL